MGNEAACTAEIDGQTVSVRALLETDTIEVRGDRRMKVRFSEMNLIQADGGVLLLRTSQHELRLHLDEQAARWAEKIRNPKSVVQKIGVREGQRVSVVGEIAQSFLADVERGGADVSTRTRKDSDVIFFAANEREDLARLRVLGAFLRPDGALWVIRPKGSKAISEADVLVAGKAAGMIDVKVVRFSETHTAEKFVIPKTKRK